MSWRVGQSFLRGPKPLGAMMNAVFMAIQKPVAEQLLVQFSQNMKKMLDDVPPDINWPEFQAGVQRCMANNWQAHRPEYPMVHKIGRVSLKDACGDAMPAADAETIVLVPSMVNRGYVLDLYEGRSLTAFLRQQGYRVLLIDWGDPTVPDAEGILDSPLDLDTVIADRLVPLLNLAVQAHGSITLVGYCMGGLLTTAASLLMPEGAVKRMAALAMPWDFSATSSAQHIALARPFLEPWLAKQEQAETSESATKGPVIADLVPSEVMQQYFWMLDPWSPIRRLMAYGRAAEGPELEFATALEDWLADGLPLDGPVARTMLFDWYGDNKPFKGEWWLRDKLISASALTMPVWVVVPQRDVLVPPASSMPFAALVKNVQVHMAGTGHVGLVCGRGCQSQLFLPMLEWLQRN